MCVYTDTIDVVKPGSPDEICPNISTGLTSGFTPEKRLTKMVFKEVLTQIEPKKSRYLFQRGRLHPISPSRVRSISNCTATVNVAGNVEPAKLYALAVFYELTANALEFIFPIYNRL